MCSIRTIIIITVCTIMYVNVRVLCYIAATLYLPVDGLEEGVGLDVLDAVGAVAESVLRVALEEHAQERLCLSGEELRHTQLSPGGGGGGTCTSLGTYNVYIYNM